MLLLKISIVILKRYDLHDILAKRVKREVFKQLCILFFNVALDPHKAEHPQQSIEFQRKETK